ncbi:MAG: DUF4160 domain-containing protein [Fimbriimonadaceae bacterium]|nr:DUF4160 domain-containing protein [Fimbriimonadaceae bacterium]
MPTVLRFGPYRWFCYSSDNTEPRPGHVERDGVLAKFWIEPVELARSSGFSRLDLRDRLREAEAHQAEFRRAWDEYFGPRD